MDPNQQAACDYDRQSQEDYRIECEIRDRAQSRLLTLDKTDWEEAAKNTSVVFVEQIRVALVKSWEAQRKGDIDTMREQRMEVGRLLDLILYTYFYDDEEPSVKKHSTFEGPTQAPG